MKSAALEAHFENITQKPEHTPPHEMLRQQAMNEAMKFGIPADIATRVIDDRLAVVKGLFDKMREESKNTGGKLAELRSNIDADMLARQVQMNHGPEEIQSQLDAIQARYRDDISSLIQETAGV